MFSNTGLSSIFKKINLTNVVTNVNKTLTVINKAIPVYKQAKPIFKNVKDVFNIYNTSKEAKNELVKEEIKSKTRPIQNYKKTGMYYKHDRGNISLDTLKFFQ